MLKPTLSGGFAGGHALAPSSGGRRDGRQIVPFLFVLLIDLMLITFWSPLTSWLPSLIK